MVNPSFRTFEIDRETLLPVSMQTHFLNITAIKQGKVSNFGFHHDFMQQWGLKDLSPRSLEGLSERIKNDEKTALEYANLALLRSVGEIISECNQECRLKYSCDSSHAINAESRKC